MIPSENKEIIKKILEEEKLKEVSPEELKSLEYDTQTNLNILKGGEVHFENINQGEHKNLWYFGKLFKNRIDDFKEGITLFKGSDDFKEGIILGKNILLNNVELMKLGGKIIEKGENQIKKIGLNYKHQLEPNKSYWSNEGDYSIKEYLNTKEDKLIEDKKEFYDMIYNKIEHYIDISDKDIFDVATCWVIGTYFYELFETYGYLYFRGMRESGKSKFKKILRLIGFNGQEASSISEASFFRTIENTKGLLCLDEYEKMDTDRKRATDLLLNAGIEQGATVKRYDVDLKGNRSFDVYCPKIICNITGLPITTQSRCVTIEMARTITNKGKLKPRIKDPDWKLLRNMCFCFTMEHWKEIKKIYENYDYSEINNREEDLWRPILSIASFFGKDIEDNCKSYCEKITEKMRNDELDVNIDYQLLLDLIGMFESDPSQRFLTTREITHHIKQKANIQFGEKNPERVTAWHLRNFNLFKVARTDKARGWTIGRKDILNAMLSRDFPIPNEYKNDINDIKLPPRRYTPTNLKKAEKMTLPLKSKEKEEKNGQEK